MDNRTSALEEAVGRFGEAWANGDAIVLDSLLSPTYTHTDVFGKLSDRATWLAYASRRTDRTTSIEFRDIRIRVSGEIGIVTGINDLQGGGIRDAADRKTLTLAFTQVWVWQQGRWLREAFQATPIVKDIAS
ncbi:MAG TPA: nuclear transport factor 2 family protein [Dongiaceae bacterium]|jgi:ketosteroid isomerase-like protein